MPDQPAHFDAIRQRITGIFTGMRLETGIEIKAKYTGEAWTAQIMVSGAIEGLPVKYLFGIVNEPEELKRNRVGQFADMIKAAGASKGYLIYHHWPKLKVRNFEPGNGIDIINRDQFLSGEVLIEPVVPVKFFRPVLRSAEIDETVHPNNQMMLNPTVDLTCDPQDRGMISLDAGATTTPVGDYIAQQYLERQPNLLANEKLRLDDQRVSTRWNNAWLLTDLIISFKWNKPAYLVFLTAAEIREYKNQWKARPSLSTIRSKIVDFPRKKGGSKPGTRTA